MSREAFDALDRGSRGRRRHSTDVVLSVLLLALCSGCVTGTQGTSKQSLFSQKETGTASMEPSHVCPNCSVPVGVTGSSSQHQASHEAALPDGNAQANSPSAVSTPQSVPAVPIMAQVPPEGITVPVGTTPGAQGVPAPSMVQTLPNTTTPATPQAPVVMGSTPANVLTSNQTAPPQVIWNHQPYILMPAPVQQQLTSQAIAAPPQPTPGGQKTWEQIQLERQRMQDGTSAQFSQGAAPSIVVTQPAASSQVPACPPGFQTHGVTDPSVYIHPSNLAATGSNGCPPTQAEIDAANCRIELESMRSDMERLQRSNEDTARASQQMYEQLRRKCENMESQIEEEHLKSLLYFDALEQSIRETPGDDDSVGPPPQASGRGRRSTPSQTPTKVRSVSRTQAESVKLPAVDE